MQPKKPAKKDPTKAGASLKAKTSGKKVPGNGEYQAPSWYAWNGVKLAMPNSPLTPDEDKEEGIPRLVSDEEYRQSALSSMRGYLELADRIERMDETLKRYECIWIAGAVRAYASQIYLKPPRGRGAAPKIDPLSTVMRYITLRRDRGMDRAAAIAQLEDDLGVTGPAIGNVLEKYREQVDLLEEAFYVRKLKRE